VERDVGRGAADPHHPPARRLSAAITRSTPIAFTRCAVDPYPRAGQRLVSGASGSRLQLTALSVTTVRVELDANGDGTFEQSRELPWGALIWRGAATRRGPGDDPPRAASGLASRRRPPCPRRRSPRCVAT
jgi:hypothetical protein